MQDPKYLIPWKSQELSMQDGWHPQWGLGCRVKAGRSSKANLQTSELIVQDKCTIV